MLTDFGGYIRRNCSKWSKRELVKMLKEAKTIQSILEKEIKKLEGVI